MKRLDCIRTIVNRRRDDIIVAVYGTAMDLMQTQPHPLNYYAVGAMGLASSHGLGLALGQPHRRVIVFDGDGSLLMNLGSLVTAAEVAPTNFFHFVFENGTYEANGGHPIPGRESADLVALAEAAGHRKTYRFTDLEQLETGIDDVLGNAGPVFVSLVIAPQEPGFIDYKGMYAPEMRQAFSAAVRGTTAPQAQ